MCGTLAAVTGPWVAHQAAILRGLLRAALRQLCAPLEESALPPPALSGANLLDVRSASFEPLAAGRHQPGWPHCQDSALRTSLTKRPVNAMSPASSGEACEECLAITISRLASMNRFCPWIPSPNSRGATPRSTYHLSR